MKIVILLSLVAAIYAIDPIILPPIGRLSPVGNVGGKAYYTDINLNLVRFGKWIEVCHENEMMPATVTSSAQNAMLTQFLDSLETNHIFWLGATDLLHESEWFWISTGETLASTYRHWGLTEPKNDRVHNCAFIDARVLPPGLGFWKSNICADGLNRPLCEIPESRVFELAAKFNRASQ